MDKIIFEYFDKDKQQYVQESAWANKIGNYFKLDNILFYAPEYSWGDVVKVEERNGELYVMGLVEESGHSTIRMIFYKKEDVQPTRDQLEKMKCASEISDIPTLISVDIPPEVNYKSIKQYLDEGEINHKWSYQEACLAHNPTTPPPG